MDIVLLPQHWASILAICIMIGALVIAYAKKWMMTYTIIIANFIVFILTYIFYYEIVLGFTIGLPYAGLGFRSIYLSAELFPQMYTLFTSMFVHGGFAHIFGYMLVF